MSKDNNFNLFVILDSLQNDIKKAKWVSIAGAFSLSFLLLILLPLSILLFYILFVRSDMHLLNSHMTSLFDNTQFLLLSYTLMLVYYFAVMYFYDKRLHLENRENYNLAIKFFIVSLFISILVAIIGSNFMLVAIYAISFVSTVYYISKTYYDVPFHRKETKLYRGEELGWFGGYMDNPFTFEDDINRARLMVQSSTVGFDLVAIFIDSIVKSLVFLYAIRYEKNIREAARLFDYLLEEKLNVDMSIFSYQSKVILESVNYLSFRDGEITLLEKGENIAKEAKIPKNNKD